MKKRADSPSIAGALGDHEDRVRKLEFALAQGLIRYGVDNVGDWLLIEATGDDTLTDFYGMKFDAPSGFEFVSQGAGGNFTATLDNLLSITALDMIYTGTGSHVVDFTGQATVNLNEALFAGHYNVDADTGMRLRTKNTLLEILSRGGNIHVDAGGGDVKLIGGPVDVVVGAGQTFTVRDHLGNPQIQWTEGDVDLHIPTGGTVVDDL